MSPRQRLRLLPGGLVDSSVRPGGLAGGPTSDHTSSAPSPLRLLLGRPGACPGYSTLLIALFDDSASVAAPGGTDPISARYDEARQAFAHVGRRCTCGHCQAAVIHFDLVGGCGPLPLGRGGLGRRYRLPHQLAGALREPRWGAGSSVLGEALGEAERLIDAASDDTQVFLVVFSDFALLDHDYAQVIGRLAAVDGDVHAVVLGRSTELLDLDERIRVTPVGWDDPPGMAAHALLDSLTMARPGAQLPPGPEGLS